MRSPSSCHPNKPVHGRNLCASCYFTAVRTGKIQARKKSTCHPDKSNYARGECYSCWRKTKYVPGANSEKLRENAYKRLYGVSIAWYDETLEKQGGKCAGCGTDKPTNRYFDVDHDHKTGKARGLLCRACNRLVGFLEDPRRVTLDAYIASYKELV